MTFRTGVCVCAVIRLFVCTAEALFADIFQCTTDTLMPVSPSVPKIQKYILIRTAQDVAR